MRRRPLRPILTLVLAAACGGDGTSPSASAFEWTVSTPSAEGLNVALLDSADLRIENEFPNVNTFLVVRHGRIAYERYYHGADLTSTFEIHSVTKSFVSAFVGIAIQQGWIESIDQPILVFLNDYFTEIEGLDLRKHDITLRHLLTMSSGLDYERTAPEFPAPEDWVAAILSAPLAHDPGTAFLYDGGNPHLLSAIVTRLAGDPLTRGFGEQALFQPLNISLGRWVTDPAGNVNGGTGMFLGARDMAKLGLLYLQDGVWEGERILPAGWAAQSMEVSFELEGAWDYGFLWWVAPPEIYGSRAWIAAGYRGQQIMVFPDLDLVVVLQSESINPRGPIVEQTFLVGRYVVPAIQ